MWTTKIIAFSQASKSWCLEIRRFQLDRRITNIFQARCPQMLSIVHGCCRNFHLQDNPTSAYQAAFAPGVQTASPHPALFVSSNPSYRSTWDHSQFLAPDGWTTRHCICIPNKTPPLGCWNNKSIHTNTCIIRSWTGTTAANEAACLHNKFRSITIQNP